MIMMYGTDLCPDCVAAKKALEENGIEYKYLNITESLGTMKQFLKLRDTKDATTRSEERRVGKECRSRWSPYH